MQMNISTGTTFDHYLHPQKEPNFGAMVIYGKKFNQKMENGQNIVFALFDPKLSPNSSPVLLKQMSCFHFLVDDDVTTSKFLTCLATILFTS